MIGMIIAFIAGWNIMKVWPIGIIFLVLFAAASNFLNVVLPYLDDPVLNPMNTSIMRIGFLYITTLAIYTVIFLLAFGLSSRFSKKKNHLRNEEDLDAPNP